MRRHGALLAAAGVVAAVALPACAPSTNGGNGDKKVHLTVLSWRPEDEGGYRQIFAGYESKHPNVKIDFRGVKATEYLAVLPNELKKAQAGPDVVQLKPYGPIQSLISGGNLVPLDGKVDVSGWPAETLQAAKGRQDGKLYGVPFALQTIQVLYNKKIFADQHISPPTTWAEFTAASDKLKKAGITPMATSGLQPWVLAIDHQIFGATRYGASDFDKAAVAGQKTFTDPDYLASLDVVKQLKPYFPDKVTAVDYPDAQAMFTSGKAAMYPGGSYELGPFEKAAPDLQIGFFEAPPAPGSTIDHPVTSGWVDGSYGVNAKSQHQAEALELVKWMATREFGQLFANDLKQISAVPGTVPGDPMLAQMLKNYQDHGEPYMMVVSFGYGNPLGRDAEGTALQKMLNGDASASDAGKEIQKGIGAWFKPGTGDAGVTRRPRLSLLLVFVLPGLLLYTVFIVYPLVSALQYSLFRWSGTRQAGFAWLGNFDDLFTKFPLSEQVWRALEHNVLFFAGTMLVQNTAGLTFAVLLFRSRRGRRFLQTAFTLPHMVSPIVVGYLWAAMLNPQFGVVNATLRAVGLDSLAQPWRGDPHLALPVAIGVNAWQWIGFPMLLFGAALAGIPEEYHEAARCDGASAWHAFRRVTLPLLTPAIGIVSVLTFVGNFNVLDLIYSLEDSQGNPAGATDVLGLLFYRTAYQNPDANSIGQSSALAVCMFLLIFGTALVASRIFRRMEARLT